MTDNFKPIPERQKGIPGLRDVSRQLRKVVKSTNPETSAVYVDREFRQEVQAHYLLNSVRHNHASLILAIDGPPGEGKTFQLEKVVKELGVPYRALNASQLSGAHEGDALIPLYDAYEQLSDEAVSLGKTGCLVVDDFDLSPAGRHSNTEYSVNSQLVSAFLMGLADSPERCRSQPVNRSAVFITGNNLTALYAPLRRKGRCRVFGWKPTPAQKVTMLEGLLSSVGCLQAQYISHRCVQEFPELPISAYRAATEEYLFAVIKLQLERGHAPSSLNIETIATKSLAELNLDSFMRAVSFIQKAEITNNLKPEQ